MKNFLLFAIALVLGSLVSSCSTNQDIVKNEEVNQYRFRKTYYRNKIIYRDAQPDAAFKEKELFTTGIAEQRVYKSSDLKQPIKPQSSLENNEIKEDKKSENTNIVSTFTDNSKHLYTSIKTGNLKSLVKKDDAPKDNRTDTKMGSEDIFAIVGFVFGILGLFFWVFALLGLIFSILGLKSNYRVFAIIGLICAAVGLALWLASLA